MGELVKTKCTSVFLQQSASDEVDLAPPVSSEPGASDWEAEEEEHFARTSLVVVWDASVVVEDHHEQTAERGELRAQRARLTITRLKIAMQSTQLIASVFGRVAECHPAPTHHHRHNRLSHGSPSMHIREDLDACWRLRAAQDAFSQLGRCSRRHCALAPATASQQPSWRDPLAPSLEVCRAPSPHLPHGALPT